jgi:hypothetical protein
VDACQALFESVRRAGKHDIVKPWLAMPSFDIAGDMSFGYASGHVKACLLVLRLCGLKLKLSVRSFSHSHDLKVVAIDWLSGSPSDNPTYDSVGRVNKLWI